MCHLRSGMFYNITLSRFILVIDINTLFFLLLVLHYVNIFQLFTDSPIYIFGYYELSLDILV